MEKIQYWVSIPSWPLGWNASIATSRFSPWGLIVNFKKGHERVLLKNHLWIASYSKRYMDLHDRILTVKIQEYFTIFCWFHSPLEVYSNILSFWSSPQSSITSTMGAFLWKWNLASYPLLGRGFNWEIMVFQIFRWICIRNTITVSWLARKNSSTYLVFSKSFCDMYGMYWGSTLINSGGIWKMYSS